MSRLRWIEPLTVIACGLIIGVAAADGLRKFQESSQGSYCFRWYSDWVDGHRFLIVMPQGYSRLSMVHHPDCACFRDLEGRDE